MAKFSKMHYEEVAKVIKEHRYPDDTYIIIEHFCNMFEKDNEKFDKDKFIRACTSEK